MKLPDIELRDIRDPGLLEFIDFTSLILNDGRYQSRIVSSVPDWTAGEGEMVLYAAGTVRRIYNYINGQWNYTSYTDSTGQTVIDIGSGNNLISGDDVNGFWVGHPTFASAPFRVTLAGALTATSATITGSITASSGTIGGFTIGESSLTAGSGATAVGLAPGSYPFYAGHTTPTSAPFYVSNAGAITASSGTIGGWDLGASTLESANDKVILDDANELISVGDTGATYLIIDGANVRIRTSDFVSGVLGTGWQIDNTYAEFNNIRARGRITTSVFEKDTISVVGGNVLIMDGDILNADM